MNQREYFATTRWTLVIAAGKPSSPQAMAALEELCGAYWYPLYAYVRRQGFSREDAEDLTQSFFARFLQKNEFEQLQRERGKFRAFLMASLQHFLANEWDKSRAQKRGGGAVPLSLDYQAAETRYTIEPPDLATPDKLYDRAWAITLLDKVLARLRKEYTDDGKSVLFDTLKTYLMVESVAIPYAEAAQATGMTEGTLRTTVHRLRKRYRELLREEVSQTLSEPTLIAAEMQTLFNAFG